MIYESIPEDFNPAFEAVGCFCQYNNRILLLLRRREKKQGNKWGIPAGKIEIREGILEAMSRELEEETGIRNNEIIYRKKIFVRYPEEDFIFHMTSITFAREEKIKVNYREHQTYRWINPRGALELDLVKGQRECTKSFYNI